MTLCQNVILTVGLRYNLSFSIYSPVYIQNMTAKAYINNILIGQMVIPNPDTFQTLVTPFYANVTSNAICFD